MSKKHINQPLDNVESQMIFKFCIIEYPEPKKFYIVEDILWPSLYLQVNYAFLPLICSGVINYLREKKRSYFNSNCFCLINLSIIIYLLTSLVPSRGWRSSLPEEQV